MLYNLNRSCVYKGVHYVVIDVLDNDLLLAVPKEFIDNDDFPCTPVVIPSDIT